MTPERVSILLEYHFKESNIPTPEEAEEFLESFFLAVRLGLKDTLTFLKEPRVNLEHIVLAGEVDFKYKRGVLILLVHLKDAATMAYWTFMMQKAVVSIHCNLDLPPSFTDKGVSSNDFLIYTTLS